MAQDYVKKRAAEALAATAGNRREAGLLLRVWAESDVKLKNALVAPFLNNICALAVQRAAAGEQRKAKPASKPEGARQASADLLSAISRSSGQTMASPRSAAPPPPASSARHRQAVTLLASAFKRRG